MTTLSNWPQIIKKVIKIMPCEPYVPLPISGFTYIYDQQYLLVVTGPVSGAQFGNASSKMYASTALGRISV